MARSKNGGLTLDVVGPGNLDVCGIGCITNSKHEGFGPKVDWLEKRFAEGLRFLLFRNEKGKPLAFLEYVPGEYAWRPVDAKGWLFVHCLWVYSAGQKVGGLGSRLIRACVDKAQEAGFTGVAAMVSDGTWMASKSIFLKNGFVKIAVADRFDLVVYRLREGPEPSFRSIVRSRDKFQGLHIVYCAQCPMLPKSVADLAEVAADHGLELNITILDSPYKAQRAPSYYGVFTLLWNGRVLSDHYVSKTRFKNILAKDVLNE